VEIGKLKKKNAKIKFVYLTENGQFDIEDFKKDSEKYFSMSNVKIAGFMTMAPFDASEYEIDNYFSKMREADNIILC